MTRRKHRVEITRWPDIWKRIQDEIFRHETPLDIRKAALTRDTSCRRQGDVMHIRVPANIAEYIELHMSDFKDIIWPFVQSHHCNKLIYD